MVAETIARAAQVVGWCLCALIVVGPIVRFAQAQRVENDALSRAIASQPIPVDAGTKSDAGTAPRWKLGDRALLGDASAGADRGYLIFEWVHDLIDYSKSVAAGDSVGVAEASPKGIWVPAGSRVLVIDVLEDGAGAEVRVLEGPSAGKKGKTFGALLRPDTRR